jgi:hypothetical protein
MPRPEAQVRRNQRITGAEDCEHGAEVCLTRFKQTVNQRAGPQVGEPIATTSASILLGFPTKELIKQLVIWFM